MSKPKLGDLWVYKLGDTQITGKIISRPLFGLFHKVSFTDGNHSYVKLLWARRAVALIMERPHVTPKTEV